jgi:hypothetical protein
MHRAYFNGYELWTCLTTPFLLAMDSVRVEETESWPEGLETWRVLRAYFPGSIEAAVGASLEREETTAAHDRGIDLFLPIPAIRAPVLVNDPG